jgi:hypothetical protein
MRYKPEVFYLCSYPPSIYPRPFARAYLMFIQLRPRRSSAEVLHDAQRAVCFFTAAIAVAMSRICYHFGPIIIAPIVYLFY